MRINTFLISADTRNARRIVTTKASADPDGMGIGRISAKQFVSIGFSSLQGLALPAIDCIGERPHGDIVVSLQGHSPRMGSACLVINADDVARRIHVGEPFMSTLSGAHRLSVGSDSVSDSTAFCAAPIPRLLMQVCNRDNDDLDACRLIAQAIGRPLHLTTANRATQRVPCHEKIVDAGMVFQASYEIHPVRCVVVPDSLNKLLMRGEQESCLQTFFPRSEKTRSASIAPSSPAW
jgi:hypothetical protein